MMTEAEIRAAVEDRVDAGEGQCNSGWFMHNDGVVRGQLWALTGEDPGTHLFNRVADIYRGMGAKVVEVRGHFHYAMPGEPDDTADDCDVCREDKEKNRAVDQLVS